MAEAPPKPEGMSTPMPTIPKPLHRERTPARLCESCHAAWLTSANEDRFCYQCGGWTMQRLSALEALGSATGNQVGVAGREQIGAVIEELMVA